MSPEKLFIRDLILLCEQYGMVLLMNYMENDVEIINHKTSDNAGCYDTVLRMMRELE